MAIQAQLVLIHKSYRGKIARMGIMAALTFSLFRRTMHVFFLKFFLLFLVAGEAQFSVRRNNAERIRVAQRLVASGALAKFQRCMYRLPEQSLIS